MCQYVICRYLYVSAFASLQIDSWSFWEKDVLKPNVNDVVLNFSEQIFKYFTDGKKSARTCKAGGGVLESLPSCP